MSEELTAHQGKVPMAMNINKGILGSFQKLEGRRAYPSGMRFSQRKKKMKRGHARRKGTRNWAVFHPYEAPRVRPRMRAIIPKSIEKLPTKSRRLNRSRLSLHSSAIAGFVFGTTKIAAMANGNLRGSVLRREQCRETYTIKQTPRKNHLQAAI